MTRTTEEILDALERDGILNVDTILVHTDEAVVEVDGNIGRLVEFLGVHRQFQHVTRALLGSFAVMQDRAWNDGAFEIADAIAEVSFGLGQTWGTYPVILRAMRTVDPKLVDGRLPTVVRESRCVLHGCPTSSGRCAECDRASADIGAQARGEIER